MYKTDRNATANSLALHGFTFKDFNNEHLFNFCESWLVKHGFEPTKMGGKGDKNITFSRGKKALEKENYERIRTDGLSILALPSDDQVGTEAFDFKAMISMGKSEAELKENTIVFSWGDRLLPWQKDIFLKLVKDLSAFFEHSYGYVFQRSFKMGPIFYPFGVITGFSFKQKFPEEDQITAWSNIGTLKHSKYKPHFIRDVYRLNFLSPQHLDGPVAGGTLRDWIKASPERGTLEPVVGDLWCWEVEEENIPKVREDLKPHNILIAFMDY